MHEQFTHDFRHAQLNRVPRELSVELSVEVVMQTAAT